MNERVFNALGLRKEAGAKGRMVGWLLKRLNKYPTGKLARRVLGPQGTASVNTIAKGIHDRKLARVLGARWDARDTKFINDAVEAIAAPGGNGLFGNPETLADVATQVMTGLNDVTTSGAGLLKRVRMRQIINGVDSNVIPSYDNGAGYGIGRLLLDNLQKAKGVGPYKTK